MHMNVIFTKIILLAIVVLLPECSWAFITTRENTSSVLEWLLPAYLWI